MAVSTPLNDVHFYNQGWRVDTADHLLGANGQVLRGPNGPLQPWHVSSTQFYTDNHGVYRNSGAFQSSSPNFQPIYFKAPQSYGRDPYYSPLDDFSNTYNGQLTYVNSGLPSIIATAHQGRPPDSSWKYQTAPAALPSLGGINRHVSTAKALNNTQPKVYRHSGLLGSGLPQIPRSRTNPSPYPTIENHASLYPSLAGWSKQYNSGISVLEPGPTSYFNPRRFNSHPTTAAVGKQGSIKRSQSFPHLNSR